MFAQTFLMVFSSQRIFQFISFVLHSSPIVISHNADCRGNVITKLFEIFIQIMPYLAINTFTVD